MTIEYIIKKKSKYKGLVIDTNLLLLLLVGIFDKSQIETYKRISKYDVDDFNKLLILIEIFTDKIFITPNILTEICNLSEGFNETADYLFFPFIEDIVRSYNEDLEKTTEIMRKNSACFYKLGLADASIINLAEQDSLVITDDLKLYHFLISKRLDAINYNHLITL